VKPIALGSDEAGAGLRRAIAVHLRALGHEVADFGVDDDSLAYPSVAFGVAERVAGGLHERAILCCGTGIGMAIAANKVTGVYAANCHDVYSAQRARKSNNAQVLTLGERVVGKELALVIVDAWLESEFEAGGSAAKVEEISRREQQQP
jgi:ribose 5-phosphate isomerase B